MNEENKNKSLIGKIKASFSGRKFRSGAYATILSVVVIVIVLVVNLLVTKMDITFDLTASSKYSLTKDTKEILKNLKDDITIYYMVQQNTSYDEFTDIEKIARKYDKLSDKIELVEKDPVLYPQFASQYVDEEVTEGSFIVVDHTTDRAKYIPVTDMIIQQTNYQTFQTRTTGTDAEGRLTSAILYVTSNDLPKLYAVQGHGESDMSQTFTETLDKLNVETETISTVTQSSIPEDCGILYINTPKKDFTDEETTMIKDYLLSGGNAIITADYNSAGLTNFISILEAYGIELSDGVVFEGDINMMYPNYPTALLPEIESHEVTSKANSSNIPILLLQASGLSISDTKKSSVEVKPLLTTSDSAYAKVDVKNITTASKEDGDISGPFYVGLAATDSYNGVESKVIVFSSESTFSDETSNFANLELLSGTVGFLAGDTSTVSIPSKVFGYTYIYPSSVQGLVWGAITVIILPVIIFASGAVICLRRRKK